MARLKYPEKVPSEGFLGLCSVMKWVRQGKVIGGKKGKKNGLTLKLKIRGTNNIRSLPSYTLQEMVRFRYPLPSLDVAASLASHVGYIQLH